MPQLFGRTYSKEELQQSVSGMAQIAGIRLVELSDGKARGLRTAEVYTGSGFRFQVLISRAMDIGAAEMSGIPLAWVHPALGGPELYDPVGYGWGRTFGGGLVTTCGLTFFGHPEVDNDEALGLHGRISHTAASNLKVTQEWRGEDYVLEIEGEVRQIMMGAENLLMRRKITTYLGSNELVISDTISNESFRPTPHMILYHCNFGFPVVSPDSVLQVSDESVRPRDAAAAAGLDRHTRFQPPVENYPEQVFFHKPQVDSDGYAQAAIFNPSLRIGGYVRYRAAELPYLAQWKLMQKGDYVCALEPANQWETPRHVLREENR